MPTFIETAKSSGIKGDACHCQCFVKLEKVKGKYSTTQILGPNIKLWDDFLMLKIYLLIGKVEKPNPIIML